MFWPTTQERGLILASMAIGSNERTTPLRGMPRKIIVDIHPQERTAEDRFRHVRENFWGHCNGKVPERKQKRAREERLEEAQRKMGDFPGPSKSLS